MPRHRAARRHTARIPAERFPLVPHCPTDPHAVQKSRPSRWISVALPHSGQRLPAIPEFAVPFAAGDPSTSTSRSEKPSSFSTPSIASRTGVGPSADGTLYGSQHLEPVKVVLDQQPFLQE
jgi:hypothetical protein